ncbi:MAG: hypothetical protein JW384_03224 [Nitrosomonadaceae bacterium]|nr:hypothetical protein [Nitrosomonadaceae bacterium]
MTFLDFPPTLCQCRVDQHANKDEGLHLDNDMLSALQHIPRQITETIGRSGMIGVYDGKRKYFLYSYSTSCRCRAQSVYPLLALANLV